MRPRKPICYPHLLGCGWSKLRSANNGKCPYSWNFSRPRKQIAPAFEVIKKPHGPERNFEAGIVLRGGRSSTSASATAPTSYSMLAMRAQIPSMEALASSQWVAIRVRATGIVSPGTQVIPPDRKWCRQRHRTGFPGVRLLMAISSLLVSI